MVICCVPKCGTDSWKCDPSITFHDFPSTPDLAAKWIKQINSAIRLRPMWFPRGRPVICSKHFLHTDFRGDSDALKPRCVPTVFGHKYIGQNPDPNEINKINEPKKSPLIVKVNRPQECVIENDSDLRISEVRSNVNFSDVKNIGNKAGIEIHENEPSKLPQVLCHKNTQGSNRIQNNCASWTVKSPSDLLHHSTSVGGANGITVNNVSKSNPGFQCSSLSKKNLKRKEKNNSDLIEIGPNTFLKINPDIIKVNKKLTPSGNTVLQFLMDQKLAKSHGSDILPKLIQGIPPSSDQRNDCVEAAELGEANYNGGNKDTSSVPQKEAVVQHVLGHLVDTHVCEESCADLKLIDDENVNVDDSHDNPNTNKNILPAGTSAVNQDTLSDTINDNNKKSLSNNADSSFIEKAPVLLTTNMPLSHCFIDKPKYILQLKQKSRQIASLKFKVANLTKKIEELEDRCIVQERQLSYSFIKRLKTIRKNAAKGDPSATYILEQIRSYSNNSKMRWSDSTLTQCAMWCRKAPYAYEYFKKAEFFKLPCLGTVKRYMKKHPELKFQKKTTKCGPQQDDDDESSSDFDFDESDGQNDANALTDDGNDEPVTCETILSVPSELTNSTSMQPIDVKEQHERHNTESNKPCENSTDQPSEFQKEIGTQNSANNKTDGEKHSNASNCVESNGIPVTVDSSNLELQEIILPSGDVVQCYSSSVTNGTDIGSQYFIIPNVSDQSCNVDHEYSVVQTDSLPVILQNFDNSQLHLQQQDQLIFIANSSDQVECSETEVTSA